MGIRRDDMGDRGRQRVAQRVETCQTRLAEGIAVDSPKKRLILSLSAGVAVVSFMGGEGIVSFILRAMVYVVTFALVSLITLPRKTR